MAKTAEPETQDAQLKRWDRVHRIKRQVQKLESEWLITKNQAAAAKKKYDKKVAEMMRAIDEAHNGQDLLFNEDDGGEPEANGHPPGKTPLTVLGLTEKQIEKMQAAEITTVEELEAKMAADEWWHKKVKGFGEARIDKLSDALVAYRKEHPVEQAEPSEANDEEQSADE